MDNFQGADYFIAIGLAFYIIKELLGMLKQKNTAKIPTTEQQYQQSMMQQHEKMIEALTTCVAVTKSTLGKVGSIEKDVIIIKDRTDK